MSPTDETVRSMDVRAKVAELETELTRLQARLSASEARFRMLVDAAPALIWIASADGSCTGFNRTWLDFRGRRLDEEQGTGWMEGLHPEDRPGRVEMFLRHMVERTPYHGEYRLKRADGEYRWLEDSAVPYFDDGEFRGFMGLALDITDRKRGYYVPDPDSVRSVLGLTERERQVLVLIAEGKSTKDAAEKLGIGYKTADSHRTRILKKLGVHETASMVRYAIRAGLIAP